MKTTIELPDALIGPAKLAAARRGISFRELVSEAVADKLRLDAAEAKPGMRSFGKLRGLRRETARINRIIKTEFERTQTGTDSVDGHKTIVCLE